MTSTISIIRAQNDGTPTTKNNILIGSKETKEIS